MSDKPYFSLAINKPAKNRLDALTEQHKLSQSEVIETLLAASESVDLQESLAFFFANKKAAKDSERAARKEKKASLRSALSKIPDGELERLLQENGLLSA